MASQLTPFELEMPLVAIPQFDFKSKETDDLMKLADIDALVRQSSAMEVSDEDSAKTALSMALQSRKLEKAIEDSRIQITRPHLDFQRAVNKIAKDFKDTLLAIEERLHSKISDWMKAQKDNPFTMTDSISVDDGQIYTKEKWIYEIEDKTKVPDEFYSIDASLLENAVKNGIRNIPGVKIFSTETTHLRIKNT